MPNIIAGSRARMKVIFTKDGAAFDPLNVLYTSVFTPKTVGLSEAKVAYQYNVNAEIVRTGVGNYYVEQLFDTAGKLKFTWRSTAWGEEVNIEEICTVNARTVIE